jgi:hypothetical protein
MTPPWPRSDIAAERGVGEPQHRAHEHVLLGLLERDRVVEEPLLQPEAGVVDQQVDRVVASARRTSTTAS